METRGADTGRPPPLRALPDLRASDAALRARGDAARLVVSGVQPVAAMTGWLSPHQRERDARFLRFYAAHVDAGTERCIDIPSVVGAVLRGIVGRHGGDMAEVPIITIGCELVGQDAMDAVSKAFKDLKAKKPYLVLPKGAALKMMHVADAPPAVEIPPAVLVPGARRIDLE